MVCLDFIIGRGKKKNSMISIGHTPRPRPLVESSQSMALPSQPLERTYLELRENLTEETGWLSWAPFSVLMQRLLTPSHIYTRACMRVRVCVRACVHAFNFLKLQLCNDL